MKKNRKKENKGGESLSLQDFFLSHFVFMKSEKKFDFCGRFF